MATYQDLITQADIEARVSARVLAQVYDDDADGVADSAGVALLIEDASSYVLEYYFGNYTGAIDVDAIPKPLRRMALDAAHAYLALRHPEFVRADAKVMFERLDKELKRLREAMTTAIDAPPEPAANVGGEVGAIGENAPYSPPNSFTASLGDFA